MELRLYQKKAISFCKQKKKVYLAIDMGLGKTAIALHVIADLNLKALVLAPLGPSQTTWPEGIKEWDLNLPYVILHGKDKDDLFDPSVQVHIINYEGLIWLYGKLESYYKAYKKLPYNCLVLDESTFVKSHKTQRFKVLKAICEGFRYKLCLSGTPSPNSLLDLWSQYYLLDGGETLGDNFYKFQRKFYEQPKYRKFSWNIRFGAEDAIHKLIAPKTFRLQSSDYISLPERLFIRIGLELPAKERKIYQSFKKDFILKMADTQVDALNKTALNSKLRQVLQGFVYYDNEVSGQRESLFIHNLKINALKEFIESNALDNIIVCIQYKYEQEMIAKHFPQAKFITGQCDSKQKFKYIKQWNKGELPLLVVHPKSVGHGLNLQTGGHIVLWYALTYSLEDYLQLNKRLHRMGQKKTVKIFHLIFKKTIDECVYKALQDKNTSQRRLLDVLEEYTKQYLAETDA